MSKDPISRREALKRAAAACGTLAFLASCVRDVADERATTDASVDLGAGVLDARELRLMEAIADTLLPDTAASPGAKAAGVAAGIQLLLTDCYDAAAQRRVKEGLRNLRPDHYAAMPREGRERVLRELDAAARQQPDHWFALARELSERAYFSSEVGMTKALRWIQTPGRWTGCVPLEPGQAAWG